MQLSPREEILLELYRGLHIDQRNEIVRNIRALMEANRYTADKLGGKPLKIVSDARIEAKFGAAPAPNKSKKHIGQNKPQPRRPDRAQDDTDPTV